MSLAALTVVRSRLQKLRAEQVDYTNLSDRAEAFKMAAGELRFAIAGIIIIVVGAIVFYIGAVT